MIDYVAHYMKANVQLRPNVFKLAKKQLQLHERIRLEKRHAFRPLSAGV